MLRGVCDGALPKKSQTPKIEVSRSQSSHLETWRFSERPNVKIRLRNHIGRDGAEDTEYRTHDCMCNCVKPQQAAANSQDATICVV